MPTFPKPNIVISKCLEFDRCRWNGLMISSPSVVKLKKLVNFIPVCPEVEIGLGIPRKSIRMVMEGGTRFLLQNETGLDVTSKMTSFCTQFLDSLKDVDGFILKDRSPSCGNKDVKLYPSIGKVSPISGKESGFFGHAVIDKFNHLAVENEGRLNSFTIREHFFTKLFTLTAFRLLRQERERISDLTEFHAKNKFLFMACNQSVMRRLGKIAANLEKRNIHAVFEDYQQGLYNLFKKIPRANSNINVLMHGLGYFSKLLTSQEKAYFLDSLEQYRDLKVPLSVCNAILKTWIIKYKNEYLMQQTFFNPYPDELIEITDSGKARGQ